MKKKLVGDVFVCLVDSLSGVSGILGSEDLRAVPFYFTKKHLKDTKKTSSPHGLINYTDPKAFVCGLPIDLQENFSALICLPSRRKCMWQAERTLLLRGWARSCRY